MGHLVKSVCDSFIRFFVIGYIHIYFVMMRRFGLRMRGLGFALSIIREEYVFCVQDLKFWFNPKCADAYCIMPAGYWNEPETHVFLEEILERVSKDIAFIDVSASVDEMVIHAAAHRKVRHVIAFEPQVECAWAIKKSAQLNGHPHVSVVPYAATEKQGFIDFKYSVRNPTAAAVVSNGVFGSIKVPCVTLDETIRPMRDLHTIMLIDVEGHEPFVMRGALKLVREALPLIIFEYNTTSKLHFSLDDIHDILPDSYRFYRLRGDGRLDHDFSNSWNCIAAPDGTDFAKICKDSIV